MRVLPVIETAVDNGVVHGRAHGQPHDGQVNLLNKLLQVEIRVDVRQGKKMWKGNQQMAKVHTTTIIILTTWQESETGKTSSTSSLYNGYFLSYPAHLLCTV